MLPATTVFATGHAWLAPLPPDGASAIMYRDTAHAPQMAASQRITAAALHAVGTVHHVILEHDADTAESLNQAVAAECAARLSR